MKVRASIKKRSEDCKIVRRKGKVDQQIIYCHKAVGLGKIAVIGVQHNVSCGLHIKHRPFWYRRKYR